MRISLSYADVPPLEVPDSNLVACLKPRTIEPSRPVAELVEEALEHPIGSPPLEKLVSVRPAVIVVVNDTTRQTPAWALLHADLRHHPARSNGPGRGRIIISTWA